MSDETKDTTAIIFAIAATTEIPRHARHDLIRGVLKHKLGIDIGEMNERNP